MHGRPKQPFGPHATPGTMSLRQYVASFPYPRGQVAGCRSGSRSGWPTSKSAASVTPSTALEFEFPPAATEGGGKGTEVSAGHGGGTTEALTEKMTSEGMTGGVREEVPLHVFLGGGGGRGWREARQALLSAGACPRAVSEAWVANHYRWVVWKLASHTRMLLPHSHAEGEEAGEMDPPSASKGATLPGLEWEEVIRQLQHRWVRNGCGIMGILVANRL